MIKGIKTKYGKPLLEWEDLECYVKDLENEIERLNYIIDKQDRDITALSNGNRKLNNIINEIKKLDLYISEEDYDYEENPIDKYIPFDIEDYIKELKGDSSN